MLYSRYSRLPEPSNTLRVVVNMISGVRKLLLRHFFLPRPEFMRKQYIPLAPDAKTGRYNSVEYLSYPWYVKPSFSKRWGPKAWLTRALGRKLPGDDGNRYCPEGYRFDEIGPAGLEGKGITEMEATRAQLALQDRGCCPFTPR